MQFGYHFIYIFLLNMSRSMILLFSQASQRSSILSGRSFFPYASWNTLKQPLNLCFSRFKNISVKLKKSLTAFSKRPSFNSGLDRRRVNEKRYRIESNAVTNETVSV